MPGAPVLAQHRLLAPCLEVGAPVAVGGPSALAEWGLRPGRPPRVHLLVPADRHPRSSDGVVVHRTRRWRPEDLTYRGPVPILTAARAIIDSSGRAGVRELRRMLDEGRRLGVVSVEEARAVRESIGFGRGRRLRLVDRALLDRRLELPATDSKGEQWALDVLTQAGLEPVHHHLVRLDGKLFELDAALLRWKIDVEFDGVVTHTGVVAFFEDPERDRILRRHGWYVTRVTAETTAPALLAEIHAEIDRQRTMGPGAEPHVR